MGSWPGGKYLLPMPCFSSPSHNVFKQQSAARKGDGKIGHSRRAVSLSHEWAMLDPCGFGLPNRCPLFNVNVVLVGSLFGLARGALLSEPFLAWGNLQHSWLVSCGHQAWNWGEIGFDVWRGRLFFGGVAEMYLSPPVSYSQHFVASPCGE